MAWTDKEEKEEEKTPKQATTKKPTNNYEINVTSFLDSNSIW